MGRYLAKKRQHAEIAAQPEAGAHALQSTWYHRCVKYCVQVPQVMAVETQPELVPSSAESTGQFWKALDNSALAEAGAFLDPRSAIAFASLCSGT